MLNIPPTTLEQYRAHYDGEYNGKITAQAVADYITKDFEPNENMAFGSAFHEMLEHGPEAYQAAPGHYHVPVSYWPQGIELSDVHAAMATDYRKDHPHMTYEVPGETIIRGINGFDVRCRYKLDGIEGLRIYEQKTTRSSYKKTWDSYRRSVQWRLYLLSNPEAHSVTYSVFQFKTYKRSGTTIGKRHEFEYQAYPTLEQDIREYLFGFIEFLRHWGLTDRLRVRSRPS